MTVTDIAELVHYHLVLSEDDPASAERNLEELTWAIMHMPTGARDAVQWMTCDRCGASVSTDVIDHVISPADSFCCSDCATQA